MGFEGLLRLKPTEGTGETDSPAEETRFEPPVPLAKLSLVCGPTAPPRDDKSEMLRDVRLWSPRLKEAVPCRPFSRSQPADTASSAISSNILAELSPSPAS